MAGGTLLIAVPAAANTTPSPPPRDNANIRANTACRDDSDDALQHLGDIFDVIDNQYLVEVWPEHFEELHHLRSMLGILVAEDLIQNEETGAETRALAADERDGDAQHDRQQGLFTAGKVVNFVGTGTVV